MNLLALLLAQWIPAAPPGLVAWVPTLQTEFEGTALDTSQWSAIYPGTDIWNEESEAYLPSQASVSDGMLHLRAEKIPSLVFGRTQPYRSGIVTTLGKWSQRYGYFEIRAKMPAGKGMWPAFWGLPVSRDWPPEIDVLEILGDTPKQVHMTSHWGLLPLHLQKSNLWKGPDFSQDFHRFGVEWTPRRLRWYVDDTLRGENLQGVPTVPFYWLLNLAVGGTWPGYPDSTTVFPSEFQIDWMRAWQFPSDSLSSFPEPPQIHFVHPSPSQFLSIGNLANLELTLDSGSAPAKVYWYLGSSLLESTSGGNLSTTWTPDSPGSQLLSAAAVTSTGIWSSFAGTKAMVVDSTGNLISNGSFSNGTDPWTLWLQTGCHATIDTETWQGAVRGVVHPTVPGTQSWYVQLSQPLPLANLWNYSISFDASSIVPRKLQIQVQEGVAPYTEHWTKIVSVATDSVHFGPYTFVSNGDDATALFKFNVGLDTATTRLWNVRVTATSLESVRSRPSLSQIVPSQFYDLAGRKLGTQVHRVLGLVIEREGSVTRLIPRSW